MLTRDKTMLARVKTMLARIKTILAKIKTMLARVETMLARIKTMLAFRFLHLHQTRTCPYSDSSGPRSKHRSAGLSKIHCPAS